MDLLDHACPMAQGVADDVSVVRGITRSINRNYGLRYDIVRSGTANYEFGRTGSQFNLTNWIEFVLNGNPPAGASTCDPDSGTWPTYKVVSCHDCAAAVALTAAVLGVGAGYYWHEPFGYLKYVESIGRGICNNPFYFPGCVSQPPIVGEDTPRTNVVNHTYVKLRDRNYDACFRQSVDFFAYVIYLAVAFLLFWWPGLAERYYDMAFGYQINVSQSEYENHIIDTSTPLEAGGAGGMPVQEAMDFQVQ